MKDLAAEIRENEYPYALADNPDFRRVWALACDANADLAAKAQAAWQREREALRAKADAAICVVELVRVMARRDDDSDANHRLSELIAEYDLAEQALKGAGQ